MLEHAIIRAKDGFIRHEDFPHMERPAETIDIGSLHAGSRSIEEVTKINLIAALEACGGNRRRAAKRLQVSLRTIYNMIQRYDLNKSTRPRGPRKVK
jgi:transcriptional regulator of acetoin/glycerol metabolism